MHPIVSLTCRRFSSKAATWARFRLDPMICWAYYLKGEHSKPTHLET